MVAIWTICRTLLALSWKVIDSPTNFTSCAIWCWSTLKTMIYVARKTKAIVHIKWRLTSKATPFTIRCWVCAYSTVREVKVISPRLWYPARRFSYTDSTVIYIESIFTFCAGINIALVTSFSPLVITRERNTWCIEEVSYSCSSAAVTITNWASQAVSRARFQITLVGRVWFRIREI